MSVVCEIKQALIFHNSNGVADYIRNLNPGFTPDVYSIFAQIRKKS